MTSRSACRIAISRRRSATEVAVARHTNAAANRPMMAAMMRPMLCDRNSTPESACRIDSSLETTPFLPTSAVTFSTTPAAVRG